MRGNLVLARDYTGALLPRIVWDADAERVYITNEAQFQLLKAGDPEALEPVGFPREDVFEAGREEGELVVWRGDRV